MARTKLGKKKKIVKKQNVQAPEGLQKHNGFASDGKKSSDRREISNIPSRAAQKSVVQTVHTVKANNMLPEATPASQRGRGFHVKKLTDLFSKLPSDITPVVNKQVTQGEKLFLTSTPKESETVSHGIQLNIRDGGSASMPETTGTRSKRSAETEPEKTAESSAKEAIDSPAYPRKLKQRTINFYSYPVEDTRKWIKEELAKPSPRKKVVTKKLRTPTTDEMSKVLLWRSSTRRKRTLHNLTDLEVAYTIFKQTVEEFSDCASSRGTKKLIAKYEECVEQGIVKKLQEIEDFKTAQDKIKKLEKENKELSLKLGSLVDRKIRLQNKLAKRRRLG